jgi:hypothetical protein
MAEKLAPGPDRKAARAAYPPGAEHPNAALRAFLVDGLRERSVGLARLRSLAWEPYTTLRNLCEGERHCSHDGYDLTSLVGIGARPALRSLTVRSSFAVADLEPLTGLPVLESVDIDRAPATTDWSPLLRIPSLRTVTAPVDPATAAGLAERGVTVAYPQWLTPLVAHPGWPADSALVTRLLRLPGNDGAHDSEPFPDPNLGLAVLQCLIDAGHIPEPDWDEVTGRTDDEFADSDYELSFGACTAVLGVLAEYRSKLPELTEVSWDGGQDTQHACYTFRDGEDDTFTITSLAGIEQCLNLRTIHQSDLLGPCDVEPLTGLAKLENLHIDGADGTDWSPLLRMPSLRRVIAPVDGETADQLTARGVYVRTRRRPHPLVTTCAHDGLRWMVTAVLDMTEAERDRWLCERLADPTPRAVDDAGAAVIARSWLALRDPSDEVAGVALADALLHLAALHHQEGSEPYAIGAATHAADVFRDLAPGAPNVFLPRRAAALDLVAAYTGSGGSMTCGRRWWQRPQGTARRRRPTPCTCRRRSPPATASSPSWTPTLRRRRGRCRYASTPPCCAGRWPPIPRSPVTSCAP